MGGPLSRPPVIPSSRLSPPSRYFPPAPHGNPPWNGSVPSLPPPPSPPPPALSPPPLTGTHHGMARRTRHPHDPRDRPRDRQHHLHLDPGGEAPGPPARTGPVARAPRGHGHAGPAALVAGVA